MSYKPVEIDLTRHVRTPAGVRYYHKPIGSPLGGGSSGHKVVSEAKSSTARMVEKQTAARKISASAAAKREAATPKFKAKDHGPRDIEAFRNDPQVASLRERVNALSKPNPKAPSKQEVAKAAQVSAEVRKIALGSGVTGNLWQLDNERLTAAINAPNVDPERLKALKIEKSKRLAVAQNILGKKAETIEAIKKAGTDPGKIRKAIQKHAPAPVAHVFDKVANANAIHKIKNADHAQSFVDALWDWTVKAVLGIGAVVLAAHTGIILGG